jgi:putative two-component system response regulator
MGTRVLIVDDSAVMCKIIVKITRQAGYELEQVSEVFNGQEAPAKFAPDSTDVIFCHLNMSQMDGYEFARRIRQINPTIPIVLVTAEGSPGKMQRALQLGVTDSLTKPPSAVELEEKLLSK